MPASPILEIKLLWPELVPPTVLPTESLMKMDEVPPIVLSLAPFAISTVPELFSTVLCCRYRRGR
jgi:hypothetical protein